MRINWLIIAAISGIIAFILELPNFLFAIFDLDIVFMIGPSWITIYNFVNSIIIRIIFLLAYILFLVGFILIGKKINNKLLEYTSYVWVITAVFFSIMDLMGFKQFLIASIITGGILSVIWGVAFCIRKGEKYIYPLVTGIALIVMGLLTASYFLTFFGDLLVIPTWIMEIILVFYFNSKL